METNYAVTFSLIWLFHVMAAGAAEQKRNSGGARRKRPESNGKEGALGSGRNVSGVQRIWGGTETRPHEFPFQVLLVFDGWNWCAGLVLDKDWVMSACHCASEEGNISLHVFYAGKHNQTTPESTEQRVDVIEIVRQENYQEAPRASNDIALFKVSPPFQFNEYVQKVALPKRRDEKYSTGTATAIGWGLAEDYEEIEKPNLRKVSLPLMTNEKCNELIEPKEPGTTILPVHICAGGEKGICNGDSGGPLLFMEDGREVVIGITSWMLDCRYDTPSVFTRVTEFLDWIENKTGLNLSDNADRELSVGATSGGQGSENVRAKISIGLAKTMCKGYDDFKNEKKLAPAFKVRPKASEKCGWAKWSKCQDGRSCPPFSFVTCNV